MLQPESDLSYEVPSSVSSEAGQVPLVRGAERMSYRERSRKKGGGERREEEKSVQVLVAQEAEDLLEEQQCFLPFRTQRARSSVSLNDGVEVGGC